MQVQRRHRPGEAIFAVVILLLSLFFVWQSYLIAGFSALSSPGAFPLAVSVIMAISALIVVVGSLKSRAPGAGDKPVVQGKAESFFGDVLPLIIVVFYALVLGFALALGTLGFLPAALAFLFLSILFLRRKGVGFSFFVALACLVGIYVVFRLIFKVVLPEGIVPEREIMAYVQSLFASGGGN